MIAGDFLKNNEGVSVSVSFILLFAVTVIVFTATVLSFYSISQNAEKNAQREGFRLLGGGLAGRITEMDTLVNATQARGGKVNLLEYDLSIHDSIAGQSFTVNLADEKIILEAEDSIKFTVSLGISSNATGKIYSGTGNYQLEFDNANDRISIKEK